MIKHQHMEGIKGDVISITHAMHLSKTHPWDRRIWNVTNIMNSRRKAYNQYFVATMPRSLFQRLWAESNSIVIHIRNIRNIDIYFTSEKFDLVNTKHLLSDNTLRVFWETNYPVTSWYSWTLLSECFSVDLEVEPCF